MAQSSRRPGRNSPCPCGSGKKYKNCCFQKDEAAAEQANLAQRSTALQRQLNPEWPDEGTTPLWPRNGVEQQMNRGELYWAALRKRTGGGVPEVPPPPGNDRPFILQALDAPRKGGKKKKKKGEDESSLGWLP